MNRTIALLALYAAACGSKTSSTSTDVASNPPAAVVLHTPDSDGIDLRVSNGKQGAPAYDHTKVAPATKLGDADVATLLKRAAPIKSDLADQQAFALRPRSTPPPRTGTTVHGAFPPPASSLLPPAASDAGKGLEVLRFMPQGAVPLAPELSVTFSQPMVAVTSQTDASKTTPVKLTPTPPKGHWRWIGTRTILFDPDVRFPQATTYQVEIPAGTKSATGTALAKAVTFSFETPTPSIVSSYPDANEPRRTDTPMFVLFDQKIDPQAVMANVHVTADGKAVQTQILDASAIAASTDKQLKQIVDATTKDEQAGRWLAFKPSSAMPTNATIKVEIGAGTPSAEGTNKTKAAQSFSFQTYPPLRLANADCGGGGECRPGNPLVFVFNNPLDADKFEDQIVSITPAIPDAKILVSYSNLIVQGATKARTSYRVTVSSKLLDGFGQTLGTDESHTFSVGDAYPMFYGPNGMVVLDPSAAKPALDFFTTNYAQLKVKLYKVEPSDYDAFLYYLQNQWNHDKPPTMPGSLVVDTKTATQPGNNTLVETSVDLAPALAHGLGHVIAFVEPYPWNEKSPPPRMIAWIQSTKIGIDAHADNDQLIAFATDLVTGKPAANIAVEMRPFGITGTTDAAGIAKLDLATHPDTRSHYLLARRGDDTAFVADPNSYYGGGGGWWHQPRGRTVAWYVTDDRQMYKPGEEVNLKGWLRTIDTAKNGDVGAISGITGVTYTVHDSQGAQIATGTATVNAIGGFDTKFTLPKTPNLGYANVSFQTQGGVVTTYAHGFQIQEFRRPEFEVSAQASQGPFIVGGSGDVTVSAKYYSGGPLPGAPVAWNVTASQTSFTPPNRDEFIFGQWVPWWGYRESFDYDERGMYGRKPPKSWNLVAKTDATGAHVMHLDFLGVKPAMPMSVMTNVSVTDVNRQSWSAGAALIVHPSSLYVGVRTKKPFVDKGQPFPIDLIGVDLDGKAVPGAKIAVHAVRLDWEYKRGKYETKEVDPQDCAAVAAKDPVPCEFKTTHGGTYQLTATITDAQGRPNTTKLQFWVTGGDRIPARDVQQEVVQIIPDRKDYAPGQAAQLLVQAPFYPAEGIVSWRRSGIVKSERITFDGPTKVISVPITDAMTPNVYVQVDLVGAAARLDDKGNPDPKLPKRPAYAVGTIDLPIPPKQRTLAVTVAPSAAKLSPGDKASIAIEVKDASGKPVANAETAVIVVDEAILSLTGYKFVDPVDIFYSQRGTDATDVFNRSYVKLTKPQADQFAGLDRGDNGAAPGRGVAFAAVTAATTPEAPPPADASIAPAKPMEAQLNQRAKGFKAEEKSLDARQPQPQIAIRSNFNPLAAFSPAVKTGADGKATVEIKMPDNLTRYRIVAISVAGDRQFGKGESAVTARLPLMVRPSPPRFLNFGDTFRLPVVIQNQTDAPMTVKLAIRTTNASITDGAGREVSVPANDRMEVQFPAAAEMAGTARFQIVGVAGAYSDASEIALPVWTPATTEAFATYGVIDDGAIKQPVALPGKVVTQFGGLEVTTASTNLQALTDAMLYLIRYPFECAEQRSSRVLAVAALKDVLTAFRTKDMPSAASMTTSVADDVEHLSQMQNGDGGFAYWDRGYPSEPYLTVYVTNALVHAKAKGFTVAPAILDRAKAYLRDIESHYPWFYSKEVRQAISAFALYTRKQMGDLDIAKGQKLLRDAGGVDKVQMEVDGWLLGLFAGNPAAETERKAIVRHALNKVSETAGAANFTTSYGDGNYLLLSSDRRVDGVMLESLIQEQKDLDLIPKIVTGLLAHRKAGRWLNTQESAFIIQALDLYFQTYEKTTPDFVARVWLGNDYAGDRAFKGRSTDEYQIDIPMKDVATHDKSDLTIQKDGAGRLYYRIGMTYAPASLKLDPADYGFVVERTYEPIDDPKDVTRAADGTWHVKAGARVRVRIKMVNENRRYHVALVDPLPAGFETMNPALAVTGPIPTDPKEQQSRGAYWWWYGPWYEHQNMRDERVEAFAALLWEGVHAYDYVARATTPGSFVVPPPKAEEMYMPETFGRGASDRVIVE